MNGDASVHIYGTQVSPFVFTAPNNNARHTCCHFTSSFSLSFLPVIVVIIPFVAGRYASIFAQDTMIFVFTAVIK